MRTAAEILTAEDAKDYRSSTRCWSTASCRRREPSSGERRSARLAEAEAVSGHLERDSDPADRRKVLLRYAEHGLTVATAFFMPLADQMRHAMADLPDGDLAAAHRVFTAVLDAMRDFQSGLDGLSAD